MGQISVNTQQQSYIGNFTDASACLPRTSSSAIAISQQKLFSIVIFNNLQKKKGRGQKMEAGCYSLFVLIHIIHRSGLSFLQAPHFVVDSYQCTV